MIQTVMFVFSIIKNRYYRTAHFRREMRRTNELRKREVQEDNHMPLV